MMKEFKWCWIYTICIYIVTVIIACASHTVEQPKTTVQYDTIIVKDTVFIPKIQYVEIHDTIVDKSLEEDLIVAKYKLNRIKAYCEIVDRKPSQIKFLKGWIKRALK